MRSILFPTLLVIVVVGCTAVVVPKGNEHQSTKITVEQRDRDAGSPGCGIYKPPLQPDIPTLDDYIANIADLDTNNDLAIDTLLGYIRVTETMRSDYQKKTDLHYKEYLQQCQERL